MRRREFLQGLSTLALAASLPLAARAANTPPWALGFEGVSEDLPPLAMTLSGAVPPGCQGTLYRNGPALYERAGQRYQHWFDPDGMIQAFDIASGAVSHRGRFVRTRRFVKESKAQRFLYGGAGTVFADSQSARNNEDYNVANISVRPFAGELLALWEAGSAYRIDPLTLETLGQQTWSPELAGVPFSAHPRVDEDGDLWNIGSVPFAGRPTLALYHLAVGGSVLKSRFHTLDFAGYMHDFVLTPKYLIALNSSAVFGSGESFVDSLSWEGDRPSQLLVFSREDFSLQATLEVPACFVFHFGNGWETGNDLAFTACQHADMQLVSTGMRRLAQQEPGPYHSGPELVRYTLELATQRVKIDSLGVELEFPGFDQRRPFAAQPLFGVSGQNSSPSGLPSAVLRIDPLSGAASQFDYGDGYLVEEPLFIPGPDGGYCVHSFLDYRHRRSGLAFLRAADLSAGPVAVAEMNRVLPLGFHGSFLARA